MKRTIAIEALLFFIVAVLIYLFISNLISAVQNLNFANDLLNSRLEEGYSEEVALREVDNIKEISTRQVLFATLLYLPAAIADFTSIVLIAVFPLPGIKPLVEKVQARREARFAARAEKAEADKQKRIEELQAELDELKKDE